MTRPPWLPQRVVVATHNPGKLAEWRVLLGSLGVEVRSAAEVGLDEPEETESTYLGNARLKARIAAERSGLPCLADDTGFEADALGGAPGVQTAGWAAAHGGYPDALFALVRDAGVGTTARLVCAVAFADRVVMLDAEARVEGRILDTPTDAPGFAAILATADGRPVEEGGVLAHRRAAFERLTSR